MENNLKIGRLSEQDLHVLSQCAISAAYKAGNYISNFTKSEIDFEYKKAGNSNASQVVTEVDKESQEIILNTLLPTCKIYDLGILTEESLDNESRLKKDYFWCIDPLDGTLPFIEKKNGYAVSIALVTNTGKPVIGVVYNPSENKLYEAIIGKGCIINNKPFSLSDKFTSKSQELTLVFDRSFVEKVYFKDIISTIKSEYPSCNINIIKHGGAVMNACWVLENQPACYFKFPKTTKGGGSLWDYAATACIFAEAGAISANIKGDEIELNRKTSTFLNHQGIIYSTEKELFNLIKKLYSIFSE